MSVAKREVLRLYRDLLRYSNSLNYTEPKYFRTRVANEFRRNRDLTDDKQITFAYKGRRFFKRPLSCEMVWALSRSLRQPLHQTISYLPQHVSFVLRHTIDYSLVPQVKEYELEEKFVRGSGPGGSAVNKNSNCVVLTHKPTGIVIKCHQSRSLDENRKIAREQLAHKLDDMENKEQSVNAQKSRIQEKKHKSSEYKRQKMHRLKCEWMEREGLK